MVYITVLLGLAALLIILGFLLRRKLQRSQGPAPVIGVSIHMEENGVCYTLSRMYGEKLLGLAAEVGGGNASVTLTEEEAKVPGALRRVFADLVKEAEADAADKKLCCDPYDDLTEESTEDLTEQLAECREEMKEIYQELARRGAPLTLLPSTHKCTQLPN